jgi:hypothetical protein
VSDDVTLNVKGLEQMLKALKGKKPVARIGILGASASRPGSDLNNAEIGAMHEHGTTQMPQRSFLRGPLEDNLNARLESLGAFDKDVLREVIATGSVKPWLLKVTAEAEGIVLEAFDTGGFGKWEPSDMSRKKNQQTLVETQQLRNSITSEVK